MFQLPLQKRNKPTNIEPSFWEIMKKNEEDFLGSAVLQMMVQKKIYVIVQLSKLTDTQDQE